MVVTAARASRSLWFAVVGVVGADGLWLPTDMYICTVQDNDLGASGFFGNKSPIIFLLLLPSFFSTILALRS